jgi:putative oxidoreductase
MKKIIKTALKHSKYENAIEIIRIYLGVGLFLKGVQFMIHPQDLVFFLSQGELNILETFISHYTISAHLVGGILMTFGLLTRLGALIQVPILIGALGFVHSKESLFSTSQNIELTALVLVLLGIFCIIGSGNLSLDYYLNDDGDQKKAWIETFIRQLFSKEGRLTLVRLTNKIRKKPDSRLNPTNQRLFNQSPLSMPSPKKTSTSTNSQKKRTSKKSIKISSRPRTSSSKKTVPSASTATTKKLTKSSLTSKNGPSKKSIKISSRPRTSSSKKIIPSASTATTKKLTKSSLTSKNGASKKPSKISSRPRSTVSKKKIAINQ